MSDIGWAVKALQDGKYVRRSGWNGKGMFLIYVSGTESVQFRPDTFFCKAAGRSVVDTDPHIDMYTAKGTVQPGWLCSQADLLADDWEIV
jgi:hypothetical protein